MFDWSQWQTYATVAGFLVVLAGFVWAALNKGTVKGLINGLIVVALGGVLLFVGFAIPITSTVVIPPPTQVPGASVIVTIPVGTGSNGIGSANSPGFSVNSGTHVVSGTIFWNSTAGQFHTKTTAGSIGTFAIPVSVSRSDGTNSSAGFNFVISNIYTQANTTNGILNSPIAYTAASGSSPGVWSILYTNGSLTGAHPSVSAPSATTMNADLLGVAAYGSGAILATFTLGGTGFFNLQVPQYSSFSFTITVTNAATSVVQGSYTVTLTDASAPPTGAL